ncbi:MAG: hypothetical protein HGA49_10025, partial [Eubacteriaceae bacterium]|nr:hypothetical protein [Eubacteriaceae bacterium]
MKKLLVTLLTICMMFSSYTPVLSARPAPVPVQSVSISPDVAELTLAAGASSTLTAIILPLNASNKRVVWTSSDITIGTVTPKGIVTALKAGTTTITVRTLDGNKTDSLLVRVIPTVTLQSAATTTDGTKVILTFNKAMTDPIGKQDEFTVHAGGAIVPVLTAALNTNPALIELTLSAPVLYGQVVTLDYTAGTITSTDGGILSNFTGRAVTNMLLDLSTASATLSVPGNKESGAAFDISITGARDVYGNLLSGSKAVTAANGGTSIYSGTPAFTSGNAVITIPAGTPSLLPAGTYTLTLTIAGVTPKPTVPVTIFVTSPAPTVSSAATLDATHILLTMSSPLTGTLAAPDAFSVSGAATNPTVTGAAVSGTSVTLTLSSKIAYGETITLSYTKTGTNNLTNGTEVANFTGRAVTNTLTNLSAASATLSVPGNKESGAAFDISITGARDVYGNLLSGNKAVTAANGAASIYSGTPAFTSGNAVITIPAGTPSLLPAGTYTLTLTIAGVTPKPAVPVTIFVTSPAPTVSSAATVDATHILLIMSSPLTGTLADPDAFSISGAATSPTVTGAAISGTSVTLTLSAKIAYGETITLSYTKTGTNNLTNGTEVANFTGRAVTNTLTDLSAASAALSVPGNKESGAAFDISITGARDVYGNLLSGNNTVTAANGATSIYSGTPAFTSGNAVITIPAGTPSLLPAGTYTLTLTIAGVTPKPTVPVTIIVTVPNDT